MVGGVNPLDFKPIVDAPLDGGGSLSIRICQADDLNTFHALMRKHHYLKGGRSAGDTLRYIVEINDSPVALLTWGAAAYKLKDRDNWINWGLGLRKTRLKLVVQNRRFCMLLKRGERPNLASQILGACLRRLRSDWYAAFGYQPLVAETFVDPDYATGTCYKATNWQLLGATAGSGRHAKDFYQRHNKPKQLWCLELVKDARKMLADPAPLPPGCQAGVLHHLVTSTEASMATCQSLMEVFEKLPDPRARSGQRYPQKQLLGILALGMLSGCRDLQSIVTLGQDLSQKQLKALGGWQRRKTGLYEAPGYNAFYNLIGQMDGEGFDSALCAWLARNEGSLPKDLALDGKVLRGSTDANGRRLNLIALIEKQTQRPIAQKPTRIVANNDQSKQEGELTAARRLLRESPALDNAVITGDAAFTRVDIAQSIVMDKGGDFVLALKDNNASLHQQVIGQFEQSHLAGRQRPFFGKDR
jgi:hypothetical protein